ncbi:MAG: type IV secretory system conjugative DNA transfer family protein [Mariprofundaceae bacterium]|nr:type IV secretory system conjugative DNA transfer family protein [Mariprofundaceae bacterium]
MARSEQSVLEAAVPATLLYLISRSLNAAGADAIFVWMFELGAGFCGLVLTVRLLGRIVSLFENRRLRKATGIYGWVERLNSHHPKKLGLHTDNKDGNGLLLGSIKRHWRDVPIFYKGDSHGLILAGTGAGKTASYSKIWAVSLGKHHNRIITAKGPDICIATYRYLTEELKHHVVCIDPYRLLKSYGIESDDFNPCDMLVKLADNRSSDIFDKAREISMCLIAEEIGASGENKIFRSVSRQIISDVLMFLAVEQADTGELVCNLPYLRTLSTSSTEDLIEVFQRMSIMPDYDGAIARAGKRFYSQFKNNLKSAQSFIVTMQEALAIFEPSTPLGKSFEHSTFKASDLKNPNKNMSVFIILPPEKSGSIDEAAGIILNSLCTTVIEADSFYPQCTIIADEFENLSNSPIPVIEKVLKIGRTRGIRLMAFCQDGQSLRARYGALSSMFWTQAAITLAMDIKSVDEAEEYSKRSGQRSIMTDSANVSEYNDGYSVSIKEEGIPLLRQDEFNRMPKFTAALWKDANPPLMLDMIHYKMVDPFVLQIDDVPNAPPEGSFPIKFKF